MVILKIIRQHVLTKFRPLNTTTTSVNFVCCCSSKTVYFFYILNQTNVWRMVLMNYLTVREAAIRLNLSEEQVKRYLRKGKSPNAYKENDKTGWRIPEDELINLKGKSRAPAVQIKASTPSPALFSEPIDNYKVEEIRELVNLAYQAVTMTSPTEEMLGYLSHVGIKRTLETLLCVQMSPKKVKNIDGFIKKAIIKGWTPTTIPIKKERNVARKQTNSMKNDEPLPFYNWLEQE